MNNFLTDRNWRDLNIQYRNAEPFDHIIIDDFFLPEIAAKLVDEFPDYDDAVWPTHYKSPIEDKKACPHWDRFPPTTYSVLHYLIGTEFETIVEQITDVKVQSDVGLHGGGWHAHTKGGHLNVHLDYNIHPKLKLQRKFNLIVYMTPDWNPDWNGGLELWSHDPENNQPNTMEKLVVNKFNRAILFDTTQNSWHGLPRDLNCPEGVVRQSLAVYYVKEAESNAVERSKALFAPYGEQANDPEVLELIKKRSSVATANDVYKGLK